MDSRYAIFLLSLSLLLLFGCIVEGEVNPYCCEKIENGKCIKLNSSITILDGGMCNDNLRICSNVKIEKNGTFSLTLPYCTLAEYKLCGEGCTILYYSQAVSKPPAWAVVEHYLFNNTRYYAGEVCKLNLLHNTLLRKTITKETPAEKEDIILPMRIGFGRNFEEAEYYGDILPLEKESSYSLLAYTPGSGECKREGGEYVCYLNGQKISRHPSFVECNIMCRNEKGLFSTANDFPLVQLNGFREMGIPWVAAITYYHPRFFIGVFHNYYLVPSPMEIIYNASDIAEKVSTYSSRYLESYSFSGSTMDSRRYILRRYLKIHPPSPPQTETALYSVQDFSPASHAVVTAYLYAKKYRITEQLPFENNVGTFSSDYERYLCQADNGLVNCGCSASECAALREFLGVEGKNAPFILKYSPRQEVPYVSKQFEVMHVGGHAYTEWRWVIVNLTSTSRFTPNYVAVYVNFTSDPIPDSITVSNGSSSARYKIFPFGRCSGDEVEVNGWKVILGFFHSACLSRKSIREKVLSNLDKIFSSLPLLNCNATYYICINPEVAGNESLFVYGGINGEAFCNSLSMDDFKTQNGYAFVGIFFPANDNHIGVCRYNQTGKYFEVVKYVYNLNTLYLGAAAERLESFSKIYEEPLLRNWGSNLVGLLHPHIFSRPAYAPYSSLSKRLEVNETICGASTWYAEVDGDFIGCREVLRNGSAEPKYTWPTIIEYERIKEKVKKYLSLGIIPILFVEDDGLYSDNGFLKLLRDVMFFIPGRRNTPPLLAYKDSSMGALMLVPGSYDSNVYPTDPATLLSRMKLIKENCPTCLTGVAVYTKLSSSGLITKSGTLLSTLNALFQGAFCKREYNSNTFSYSSCNDIFEESDFLLIGVEVDNNVPLPTLERQVKSMICVLKEVKQRYGLPIVLYFTNSGPRLDGLLTYYLDELAESGVAVLYFQKPEKDEFAALSQLIWKVEGLQRVPVKTYVNSSQCSRSSMTCVINGRTQVISGDVDVFQNFVGEASKYFTYYMCGGDVKGNYTYITRLVRVSAPRPVMYAEVGNETCYPSMPNSEFYTCWYS